MASNKRAITSYIRKCSDSKVKVEENGKKLILLNPNGYEHDVITVDGGLINDHSRRCDYLISEGTADASLFIELKGRDIKHAIAQFSATLIHNKIFPFLKMRKACVIISAKVPRHTTTIQKELLSFRRNHGIRVHIRNKKLETKLEALL